jgi:uncharacterized protein
VSEFALRPIGDADLPAVVALNELEVPRVGPLGGAGLAALMASCDLAVLAEDSAGSLAGFVLALAPGRDYASENYRFFSRRATDFLYVDRVAVAPRARRQGVATALYGAVEARAREQGRQEVTCEVNLRPPNPGSLAFHRRLGFVEVGQQDTSGGALRVALLARSLAPGAPAAPARVAEGP